VASVDNSRVLAHAFEIGGLTLGKRKRVSGWWGKKKKWF
jgi:hypothetical protein